MKGGEDIFFEGSLIPALKKLGINFELAVFEPLFSNRLNFLRDGVELLFMALGLEALRPSYFTLKKYANENFTHVFFNNWIPTVSLSAPNLFRSRGTKAFYWIHNARVFCANGLNFNGKRRCNDCVEKSSFRVLTYKCYQSRLQSLLYSLTYRNSRVLKHTANQLDGFIPVSEFAKENLESAFKQILGKSILPSKVVLPFYPQDSVGAPEKTHGLLDNYHLFIGRLSFEKGIDIFIDLARRFSNANFVVAGDGPMKSLVESANLPNLNYLGSVSGARKEWLLKNARSIVISSRAPENAPMVILESEKYGTPIVFSKGGGAQRLVEQLKRPGLELDSFNPNSFNLQSAPKNTNLAEAFLSKLKEFFS